jgi:hypothetical protein
MKYPYKQIVQKKLLENALDEEKLTKTNRIR